MGCQNGCVGNCGGTCGGHGPDIGQDPTAYKLWLAQNGRPRQMTTAIVAHSLDDYATSIAVAGFPNAAAAVRAAASIMGEDEARAYIATTRRRVGDNQLVPFLEANSAAFIKGASIGLQTMVSQANKPCGEQQTVSDSLCAMFALCSRSYRSCFSGSSLVANGQRSPTPSDQVVVYKDKPSTSYRELTSVGYLWMGMMVTPILSSSVNFPLNPTSVSGTLNNVFTFSGSSREAYAIEVQYTAKKVDARNQLPFSASTSGFLNSGGELLDASWTGHIIDPTGGFLYFMFGIDDGGNGDSGRTQLASANPGTQSLTLSGFGPEWDLTGRLVQHGTGAAFRLINSLLGGGIVK